MKKQTIIKHAIAAVEMDRKRVTLATVRAKTNGIPDEDIRKGIGEWKHERKLAEKLFFQKAQPNVYRIELSVEWYKSAMGNQAEASARVQYQDGHWERLTGDRTGGYGYDKRSTATKDIFNQCLLGMLWRRRGKEPMPYGAHRYKKYGAYFDDGVGIDSHRNVVEWLGGVWDNVHDGKMSDGYLITFKKNKPKK